MFDRVLNTPLFMKVTLTRFMKIRQPRFDNLILSRGFWSICNYHLNPSCLCSIFEAGLIFDNIFATADLTKKIHSGIIRF